MLDTKLLKKVPEGDMVATETKYHRPCLVKLYSKHRDFKRQKFVDCQDEFVQGMCTSLYLFPDPPNFTLGSHKTHLKHLLRETWLPQKPSTIHLVC